MLHTMGGIAPCAFFCHNYHLVAAIIIDANFELVSHAYLVTISVAYYVLAPGDLNTAIMIPDAAFFGHDRIPADYRFNLFLEKKRTWSRPPLMEAI